MRLDKKQIIRIFAKDIRILSNEFARMELADDKCDMTGMLEAK